ncbi:hypothetical protein CDL62_11385 [Alkalitalea saponilacus]|uniref:Uncharacterized protein n=1 Tax=Alkalitalea saponilacus TaxID=889453 RepID=A0A1T5BFU2_9BACT|nr:hypothetical protein CDL62_11385 [Alkalitalea saponilacus]SKB46172.1 hypothetical protein SAMN03080601_00507 [Alkalitalea saponilacus]
MPYILQCNNYQTLLPKVNKKKQPAQIIMLHSIKSRYLKAFLFPQKYFHKKAMPNQYRFCMAFIKKI